MPSYPHLLTRCRPSRRRATSARCARTGARPPCPPPRRHPDPGGEEERVPGGGSRGLTARDRYPAWEDGKRPVLTWVGRVAGAPEERGARNPRGAPRREAPLEFPRRQYKELVSGGVDGMDHLSPVVGCGFDSDIELFDFFSLAARKFRAGARPHIHRDNFNLHYIWQYFAVTNHADAKEGWAKNAICNFVTKASVDEALP